MHHAAIANPIPRSSCPDSPRAYLVTTTLTHRPENVPHLWGTGAWGARGPLASPIRLAGPGRGDLQAPYSASHPQPPVTGVRLTPREGSRRSGLPLEPSVLGPRWHVRPAHLAILHRHTGSRRRIERDPKLRLTSSAGLDIGESMKINTSIRAGRRQHG